MDAAHRVTHRALLSGKEWPPQRRDDAAARHQSLRASARRQRRGRRGNGWTLEWPRGLNKILGIFILRSKVAWEDFTPPEVWRVPGRPMYSENPALLQNIEPPKHL